MPPAAATCLQHFPLAMPVPQEEEAEEARRRARATREVSFEAARRIRAECAHPAIVHFYAWLLQGASLLLGLAVTVPFFAVLCCPGYQHRD